MGLPDEVARWLAGALRDAGGRDKMTKTALSKESGVSQDTIYRLLRGEGEADEETLEKLARTLGVDTPRIERTLRFQESSVRPPTALGLVRSAAADLRRAEQLLSTSGDAAAGRNQAADNLRERMAREAARDRQASQQPPRVRKRSPGA